MSDHRPENPEGEMMDAELEQDQYDAEEDKALNADIERYHEYQRRHEAPTVYADPTPEKLPFQLRVHYPHSSEHGQAASWDHILAAVRAGVESGTIKGKRVGKDDLRALRRMLRAYGHEEGLSAAINAWLNDRHLLVIPVSDGGSET